MWDHETIMMIVQGVGETLYMTVLSTVLGYLFGLPMGVLLAVSDKEGLKPNAVLYKILDAVANIVRSIPFLILLILLIPFTRAVVGKSYGSTATVVPLVVAAIPFIARMVESSIKEVDAGVIEAARAMGASNIRIIVKVLLVEARRWRLLSILEQNRPKLEFQSRKNLKAVVENPILRHKLGKFLDQHFNWYNYERIVLTDDYLPYSFFFEGYMVQGTKTCGGVILHGEENIRTAKYGIHT